MNWIVVKYIQLLSSKLDKFKKVNNQYNFRCPICGDSKKNPNKSRGWILTKGSKVFFHCFNCTATMSFRNFLRKIDVSLYDQMILEELKEKGQTPRIHTKEFLETQEFVQKLKVPEYVKTSGLAKLKKVSQLDPSHHAKVYIQGRLIPSKMHHKIFYAPEFKSWVNEIIPDKFREIGREEERLIFPLLDEDQTLIGIQGRSLDPKSDVKYITIMFDEEKPKIFGLDTLDRIKPIVALEGPIDAMFLSNAVASCGGRIEPILEQANIPKDRVVLVYDNEPRSKETVQKMEKAISSGWSVCIWPSHIKQKDINDMVLSGLEARYIRTLVLENSFSGLEAKLQFMQWKKL